MTTSRRMSTILRKCTALLQSMELETDMDDADFFNLVDDELENIKRESRCGPVAVSSDEPDHWYPDGNASATRPAEDPVSAWNLLSQDDQEQDRNYRLHTSQIRGASGRTADSERSAMASKPREEDEDGREPKSSLGRVGAIGDLSPAEEELLAEDLKRDEYLVRLLQEEYQAKLPKKVLRSPTSLSWGAPPTSTSMPAGGPRAGGTAPSATKKAPSASRGSVPAAPASSGIRKTGGPGAGTKMAASTAETVTLSSNRISPRKIEGVVLEQQKFNFYKEL
eukprot:g308.t1